MSTTLVERDLETAVNREADARQRLVRMAAAWRADHPGPGDVSATALAMAVDLWNDAHEKLTAIVNDPGVP